MFKFGKMPNKNLLACPLFLGKAAWPQCFATCASRLVCFIGNHASAATNVVGETIMNPYCMSLLLKTTADNE